MANRIVAVTGGIGTGKSVVCRVVSSLGYRVFDCDSEAKRIMDGSGEIKREIARCISEDVVADDIIDRKRLAEIVFSDAEKLCVLNAIVHKHVIEEVKRWSSLHDGVVFVETAILYESGLDRIADEVWEVTAPKRKRILRACARDGVDERKIIARIERQEETVVEHRHPRTYEIVNDDVMPVLPQILSLLKL